MRYEQNYKLTPEDLTKVLKEHFAKETGYDEKYIMVSFTAANTGGSSYREEGGYPTFTGAIVTIAADAKKRI